MENDSSESQELNHIESEQLTAITKDRVRGPQGRRLPQRKSMMPTSSPTEDILQKQRSCSLSSPTDEDDENNSENSNGENRRISLSMDAVDNAIDDDVISHNSSSNNEVILNKPKEDCRKTDSNGIILPKVPIFGKLGGQHALLTKELELKLKSGMAPGGRKMAARDTTDDHEESNNTIQEIKDLHKTVTQQDAKLSSVHNNLEALEKRVQELSTISSQSTDKTESTIAQVLEILRETVETLNEVQDTHTQCEKVLEELKDAKKEHYELIKECREHLATIKEICSSNPEKE